MILSSFLFLHFISLVSISSCESVFIDQVEQNVFEDTNFQNMSEIEMVNKMWEKFEKTTKNLVDSYMNKALPAFLKMGPDVNVSRECQNDIVSLVNGIKGLKSWAFKMLDASSKFPSGLLEGSLTDFGDYDECLDVVKFDSKKRTQFTGQYCTLAIRPFLPPMPHHVQVNTKVLDFSNFSAPDSFLSQFALEASNFYYLSIRLALCVPSGCSAEDVQRLVNLIIKDVPFIPTVQRCEAKKPVQLTKYQIGAICTIGIMMIFVIFGTYLDVKGEKISTGLISECCKCFSLNKNLSNLLKMRQSKEDIGMLNGMRFIALLWMILAHVYFLTNYSTSFRAKNLENYLNDISFSIITNSWLVVDVFFVLGAFLTSYHHLKLLDVRRGQFDFIKFYRHRLWRLMPLLIAGMLVMFLLPLLGSGPVWEEVAGREAKLCEKYWWKIIILPFNSWTQFGYMCMDPTWYAAVDIQYYFIAPIILISLYRSPILGFLIMFLLSLCCIGIIASLTLLYDLYPAILFFSPDTQFIVFHVDKLHIKPYVHFGVYCVGLSLGYLVLNYEKKELKKTFQVIGWCAAVACGSAVLFGPYEWNRGNLPNSTLVTLSYVTLHKIGFAISIAWLMFMCITKRGGLINRFLSWDFFVPLSKLSYAMYIFHFPVQKLRNGYTRTLLPTDYYSMCYRFFGDLIVILLVSVAFHLLFEAPFANLESILFSNKGKKKEDNEPKISSKKNL